MDNLPSVWGRHRDAHIDPIIIRGRLITSIMDAPPHWEDRLQGLGFKQASQSWLRMGELSPAEFQFLSPEIDLIGFRVEEVIDLPDSEISEYANAVPLDVRDTILQLWQRQSGSMLVALSMEHEVNLTRAQAWTFVEAALAGGVTPETETLYGLALTKLSMAGTLSPDAQAYADLLGWGAPDPTIALGKGRGKMELAGGEAIQWVDRGGDVRDARLARPLHQADRGAWLFDESPRWTGGYVVAAPRWVEREHLRLSVALDASDAPAIEAPVISPNPPSELPRVTELSSSGFHIALLRRLVHAEHVFPTSRWRDICAVMRENLSEAFDNDLEHEEFDEGVRWLERAEEALDGLSQHYYGRDPIKFVFSSFIEGRPTFAVSIDAGAKASVCAWTTQTFEPGDVFDIAKAAESIDRDRIVRQNVLLASAQDLASHFGIEGPAFSADVLRPANPAFWRNISEHYKHDIPADAAARIITFSTGGANQCDALLRSSRESFGLGFEMTPLPEKASGGLSVGLWQHQAEAVELNAIISALSDQSFDDAWIKAAATHKRQVYALEGEFYGNPAWKELAQSPLSKLSNKEPRQQVLYMTIGEAAKGYQQVLDSVMPLCSPSDVDKAKALKASLINLPLRDRFQKANEQLRALDDTSLSDFIRSEILRQLKQRTAEWSDDYVDRVIAKTISELRAPNAQGAILLTSSSGGSYRVRFASIPFKASALTQSRQAELQGAAADLKTRMRVRGVTAVIDGVALVDPELCQLLNGDDNILLAAASPDDRTDGNEGYRDTGVVAGLPLKDIRSFDRATLERYSEAMTDAQKAKYLTKELIWPRKSFEEMKEQGVPLWVAYSYDLLWRSLPSKPLSPSREHAQIFINLIGLMKERVSPIPNEFSAQGRYKAEDATEFVAFSQHLAKTTQEVCEAVSDLSRAYPYSQQRVRGHNLRWSNFEPHYSFKLTQAFKELAWSDVLKEKKISRSTTGGSRVARGEVKREGPDYRKGVSVDGEDFIKTFGFSGIEYGNWTNQKEREKHLNFAFDSMMDFARIMGWEPMALSLGGKLGLCIGSRGRGGKNPASAHFEPANMAINLTRMNGAGALAHEYFHAVAAHYGRAATGSPIDVTDTFGYGLRGEGALPARPANGLREELRTAFYDLVVSIMRSPSSVDDGLDADIESYTARSSMLKASIKEDGKGDYWASPREMFARSMEVWFRDRMKELGEQNDYLVPMEGKLTELYPDAEHLERINKFASPWLEALRTEIRQVAHPFLGTIEMPVLNTELRSRSPLRMGDLEHLAKHELNRLFRSYAPSHSVIDEASQRAGLYDVARDLVQLNANCADIGTFYHEAWHACNEKLLTTDEKEGLGRFFTDGPVLDTLVRSMRDQGFPETVIDHALSCPEEAQAYAFQLWTCGQFNFDSEEIRAFYTAKGFVDGVLQVGDLFTPAEAERVFSQFMSGEMAVRDQLRSGVGFTQDGRTPGGNGFESGDSDDVLFWPVGRVSASPSRGMRL